MQSLEKSIRPTKAAQMLDVGLNTLWRYAREDPDFPPLIKLSPGVTVLMQDALIKWRDAKAAKSAKATRPNAKATKAAEASSAAAKARRHSQANQAC